jgi:hypothetical protein
LARSIRTFMSDVNTSHGRPRNAVATSRVMLVVILL